MPFGARINAIFSSDIGHFDVPDMLQPVPEAYELVEDGLITAADFRDFTFANAVRLWGTQNPFSSKAPAPPNKPRQSSPKPAPRPAPPKNNLRHRPTRKQRRPRTALFLPRGTLEADKPPSTSTARRSTTLGCERFHTHEISGIFGGRTIYPQIGKRAEPGVART